MALKILHITTTNLSTTGVGRIVMSLHDEALKAGLDSHVVVGYGNGGDKIDVVGGKMMRISNALRSRFHEDDGFLRGRPTERIIKAIKRFGPDVVHIHNLHGYYCDCRSITESLQASGIPYVVTLHDLWLTTGRCAHPHRECLIAEECNQCCHLEKYPAKWVRGHSRYVEKRVILERAEVIISPSEWVARKCEALNISSEVIRNGVDRKLFEKFHSVSRRNYGRLLAVASKWTYSKGVDRLIRLADILPEDMTLTMVGMSVPQHKRIKNLGLVHNREQLAKIMAESTCILSASREETFGLTVAESLAVGTPVIVNKDTAPCELVMNRRFCIEMDDPNVILETVRHLNKFVFPELIPDRTDMAREYFELYRRVLNR